VEKKRVYLLNFSGKKKKGLNRKEPSAKPYKGGDLKIVREEKAAAPFEGNEIFLIARS